MLIVCSWCGRQYFVPKHGDTMLLNSHGICKSCEEELEQELEELPVEEEQEREE